MSEMSKHCSGCDQTLDISNFSKNTSRCKKCVSAYRKIYRAKNRDKLYQKGKEFRAKNKQAISERKKKYREANKERIAEHKKAYVAANRKHFSDYSLKYANKKYEPIKIFNAFERKFKHVLEELMLRFTFKTCIVCNEEYDLRQYQHLNQNKEVKTCLQCREKRNRKNDGSEYRKKMYNLYHEILKPYSDSVKQANCCIDCGETEWRVLEFDHIDPATKTCLVLQCKSLEAMKREIAKCCIRCIFCHQLKTLAAKKPGKYHGQKKIKHEHVNQYKLNLERCLLCDRKITQTNITAFDLDHLDRKIKRDNIGNMIVQSKYTLDDLKLELNKTRLLCKCCHRLHTLDQLFKLRD